MNAVKRIVCWFSCGAASAVATKIMLEQAPKIFPNVPVVIANSPIIEEHSDNERFFNECEQWFGQEIIRIINPRYPEGLNSIYEVFKKGFLKGVNGAPDWAKAFNTKMKQYTNGFIRCSSDVYFDDLRTAIAEHDSAQLCIGCGSPDLHKGGEIKEPKMCLDCFAEMVGFTRTSNGFVESDDVTDIRNHLSPSTVVVDL